MLERIKDFVVELDRRVRENVRTDLVKHCLEERAAGREPCGACSVCCNELRQRAEVAEAKPSVEICQENRAAGRGPCGACALCCKELRDRLELATARLPLHVRDAVSRGDAQACRKWFDEGDAYLASLQKKVDYLADQLKTAEARFEKMRESADANKKQGEHYEREAKAAAQKVAALVLELDRVSKQRDEARKAVEISTSGKGDVWFWQGDGEDDLASLTCPVVMEAEKLREILRDVEEKQRSDEVLRSNKVLTHSSVWRETTMKNAIPKEDEKVNYTNGDGKVIEAEVLFVALGDNGCYCDLRLADGRIIKLVQGSTGPVPGCWHRP